MGFQSEIDDKSDREDVFAELLQAGVDDPAIDSRQLSKLFNFCAGEVLMYLSTGWNEIIDTVQDQVDNDGEFKPLLESVGDSGYAMINVIIATLT